MRRPKKFFHMLVILRPHVIIVCKQQDRRTGGDAVAHAGENVDGVLLASRRGDRALPRLSAIKFGLNVFLRERKSRRTTVDNHADSPAVRLPARRDAKQSSKTISRHRLKRYERTPNYCVGHGMRPRSGEVLCVSDSIEKHVSCSPAARLFVAVRVRDQRVRREC